MPISRIRLACVAESSGGPSARSAKNNLSTRTPLCEPLEQDLHPADFSLHEVARGDPRQPGCDQIATIGYELGAFEGRSIEDDCLNRSQLVARYGHTRPVLVAARG